MELGIRNDPILSHQFVVELDGIIVGSFSEVSGLGVEVEVLDYQEGGQNAFRHRLPGAARASGNLVLRWGVTDVDVLWRWQEDVLQGRITRRNGSVVLVDPRGEARRWAFEGAYPVRWSGPDLRASGGTVAIESLELAHEGLRSQDVLTLVEEAGAALSRLLG